MIDPDRSQEFLKPFGVTKIPCIGIKTQQQALKQEMGIESIGQLAK